MSVEQSVQIKPIELKHLAIGKYGSRKVGAMFTNPTTPDKSKPKRSTTPLDVGILRTGYEPMRIEYRGEGQMSSCLDVRVLCI